MMVDAWRRAGKRIDTREPVALPAHSARSRQRSGEDRCCIENRGECLLRHGGYGDYVGVRVGKEKPE